MYSAIHLLNNWGQVFLDIAKIKTNKQKNIKDGVVCKAKGEEVWGSGGGGAEVEYDLKAGSTSCPHPVMVAFIPLVGKRAGSQGPRVVGKFMKSFMNFF